MVIRGPRLSLRYAGAEDVDALFELGSDPEVSRYFSWGPYADADDARTFIGRMAAQRETGERLEFAIADEDDRLIGITGLSEFAARDRRAVIGTWLGRPYWGSGANAESKALILALAFGPLGLQRISAYASPDNARSLRALERLGFTREGVLVAWHVHGGQRRDVTMLRLLREEWESGSLSKTPVSMSGDIPTRISARSQRLG